MDQKQDEFPGVFVISLDFELHWGVFDSFQLSEYSENLAGARQVIPDLLSLFRERHIHATWAVVGALYCHGRSELLHFAPNRRPNYANPIRSSYNEVVPKLGESEEDDPLHFAPSLIDLIRATPHQEIASHTFSHYYCLDPGTDSESFRADLQSAAAVAGRLGINQESIVFPQNHVRDEFLYLCSANGIKNFRGNPMHTIYQLDAQGGDRHWKRALRLLDTYIPLSGRNTSPYQALQRNVCTDVRASRFLRPWSRWLAPLTRLKEGRIMRSMEYAAQNGEIFHLWWHPHNFGIHREKNFATLERVLDTFKHLSNQYGMISCTMAEAGNRIRDFK